jgi:hypothetical protein
VCSTGMVGDSTVEISPLAPLMVQADLEQRRILRHRETECQRADTGGERDFILRKNGKKNYTHRSDRGRI